MEPDIIQAVLRFIYTDHVDLKAGNATALLAAANRYTSSIFSNGNVKTSIHFLA